MFNLSISVPEIIARVIIVYIFLFVLLRIRGKRHVGDLGPFDIIVLLILSECVQNALIGDDKSVLGGLVAAGTLFGLSQIAAWLSWHSKTAERFLEGTPRILVRNGQVCADVLAKERINNKELMEARRKEGCSSLLSVRYAVLENDGSISIGLRAQRS